MKTILNFCLLLLSHFKPIAANAWPLFFLTMVNMQAMAQTIIGKEQIEDAFLEKSGGAVYGDIHAPTSTLFAKELIITTDGSRTIKLFYDGNNAVLRTDLNLCLDPTNDGTAGAVIVPTTLMEFPDFEGDKIRLYDTCYKIGVSDYALHFTSDRHIKFHSDTVSDLLVITGDEGDVSAKRHITANGDVFSGGAYKFKYDTTGDKIFLWGTTYKMGISAFTMDFHSDQQFKWHSDTTANAMTLNADTGRLSIAGPLQLPVVGSLPSGNVGELMYLDHPSDDNQDGLYVKTAAGWEQCN
ncbi:hypothetical protein GF373_07310 [bacterium]|nr:hypothetical protein [bacterium]